MPGLGASFYPTVFTASVCRCIVKFGGRRQLAVIYPTVFTASVCRGIC